MRWFMDVAYPVMRWGRHRAAARVAQEPAAATDFDALAGARQALLVTFKRSGEPVPTPVNCALLADRRLYFRSEPDAAKVRRINNEARVLVGPCNLRGKPRGPLATGVARILSGGEKEIARAAIRDNWSPVMTAAELGLDRLGVPEAYIEVVPASAAGHGGGRV